MGLFSKLKDAIFGSAEAKEMAAPPAPAAAPAAAPAPAPEKKPIDVEAVLTYMAEKRGQPSNWRTSIVDLMKLVNMDSSLAARKELAQDLGYTGALDGSAEMNIWLHKKVMERLAQERV
jgi:3-oxoacyl-ACP reductase-like protein